MLPRTQNLVEIYQDLLKKKSFYRLKNILAKAHPADISYVYRELDTDEKKLIFDMLTSVTKSAEVISQLDENEIRTIFKDIDIYKAVEILSNMDSDDAADILGEIEEEKRAEIINRMDYKDKDEVIKLLNYPEHTAGGIMNPNFFSLDEVLTVSDAIKELRNVEEPENIFYLYVTDVMNHLVGVIPLRKLVTESQSKSLKEIMNKDLIIVNVDMDQEDVARIVSRYDLVAVPVVDNENKLVGMITVDDVIDVIREEATEDMLKMAGTDEDDIITNSSLKSAKMRMPWLIASWVGGMLALKIIGHFEGIITSIVALAGFIPVIMNLGGNIGNQSATLIVRGIATKKIDVGGYFRVIFKEIRVGLLLGIIYAILLGIFARFFYPEVTNLGIVVGIAIFVTMLTAVTVGSFIPIIFEKIKIDPAIATAPFVSTAIDILSVFIYFSVASYILTI